MKHGAWTIKFDDKVFSCDGCGVDAVSDFWEHCEWLQVRDGCKVLTSGELEGVSWFIHRRRGHDVCCCA
jgi:hypothetical protein